MDCRALPLLASCRHLRRDLVTQVLMSLLDKFAKSLGYFARKQEVEKPIVPDFMREVGASARWEISDPSLYENQAQRYTRSWLCYACVNLIAQFGASAELVVTKELSDEAILDHPFLALLSHPNPFTSRFELLESTLASMELTGNSYWYLSLDAVQRPNQIWLMRPDRTQVVPDKDFFISGFKYTVNARPILFPPKNVVHFKRFHPLKDYDGLSPIEAGNYAMATDIAAEKSSQSFYDNAMRVSAILENPKEYIEPKQRKLIEQWWKEAYTGPEKAYKPLFLWGGWKFSQLSMSPKDAEYVEGRKLNRTAILALYGVHPGLLFSEDVNRANAVVAEQMFSRITMAPKLERIAQRINLEVMPLYEDGSKVKFVNVVPEDRELEMEFHKTYLDRAAITINEVRRDLGKEPIEGGDVTLPQFLAALQTPSIETISGGLSLPPKSKLFALIGEDNARFLEGPQQMERPKEKEVVAERPRPFRWADYP